MAASRMVTSRLLQISQRICGVKRLQPVFIISTLRRICFATPQIIPSLRKSNTRHVLGSVLWVGPSLAFLGFIFNKEEELSENDQVRRIVSKGIVAKKDGNLATASQAFHDALMKSTDFLDEKKITKDEHLNHRVFIYDQIANLAMDAGDMKAAEVVFKDTMKLALQLGMDKNENAMIEMSLKLAAIYLYTGRTDTAIVGLKHCITEQQKKLEAVTQANTAAESDTPVDDTKDKEEMDNTRVLLGQAFKHLANHHLQKQEFKEAESLMQKSFEISESILGSSNDNTLAIMNDIATCHIMLKDYEKAESVLMEGIKLSGQAESVMQAALLSNLGALYIRTNRYSEAQSACERGLRVAEKGKDDFMKRPCENCLKRLTELRSANTNSNES